MEPLPASGLALGSASFSVAQYTNARSRDATSFNALGRVELDSRTQSPYGTVRAFMRVDSYLWLGRQFCDRQPRLAEQHLQHNGGNQFAARIDDRHQAFIQFAGLTAGRALRQSARF
jgi:hypothetical protein